jgi:anthranilate synthase component 1
VARAIEYIRAGDVFQVVLGQRFERRSAADPFDVYRALRAVNPSPYMVYLQAQGCILVASSPEILCRVRTEPRAHGREGGPDLRAGEASQSRLVITNRPLAGTRRRGGTPEEDAALERELLADPKERAEHTMLVDLGRNDVGRVARPGSVELPRLMEVERYSHVMHISSTVTGELREGLDAWDALRATLPVGTISGAPKIRAMQIIDELEPVRRGPYGGGMGYVSLDGDMDIALALRTMVVPTGGVVSGGDASGSIASHDADGSSESALPDTGQRPVPRISWTYHIQAAGGIVLDSRADAEFDETVNKAAALARAIDVAEEAFARSSEARTVHPAEEAR